ncbi:uncharacterized protein BO66DRAFT_397855 [Aspergillus aculeatinus CBS 121060]|uniref:Uncharacterized protein n=1 Tax=Aspergillus aculeatinus CBS 121060 TaxID=1448322 RepID=A0ACD1HLX4_9EURO|nr:hypothetical protein BO66DRAFT_397855 [Aspergillus aculeatinus CBS 121060]RAH74609.1 hypothetical protein BO66DRAFT_397855 [Aspergillus aculeatinus CBS 121060]
MMKWATIIAFIASGARTRVRFKVIKRADEKVASGMTSLWAAHDRWESSFSATSIVHEYSLTQRSEVGRHFNQQQGDCRYTQGGYTGNVRLPVVLLTYQVRERPHEGDTVVDITGPLT